MDDFDSGNGGEESDAEAAVVAMVANVSHVFAGTVEQEVFVRAGAKVIERSGAKAYSEMMLAATKASVSLVADPSLQIPDDLEWLEWAEGTLDDHGPEKGIAILVENLRMKYGEYCGTGN